MDGKHCRCCEVAISMFNDLSIEVLRLGREDILKEVLDKASESVVESLRKRLVKDE